MCRPASRVCIQCIYTFSYTPVTLDTTLLYGIHNARSAFVVCFILLINITNKYTETILYWMLNKYWPYLFSGIDRAYKNLKKWYKELIISVLKEVYEYGGVIFFCNKFFIYLSYSISSD